MGSLSLISSHKHLSMWIAIVFAIVFLFFFMSLFLFWQQNNWPVQCCHLVNILIVQKLITVCEGLGYLYIIFCIPLHSTCTVVCVLSAQTQKFGCAWKFMDHVTKLWKWNCTDSVQTGTESILWALENLGCMRFTTQNACWRQNSCHAHFTYILV